MKVLLHQLCTRDVRAFRASQKSYAILYSQDVRLETSSFECGARSFRACAGHRKLVREQQAETRRKVRAGLNVCRNTSVAAQGIYSSTGGTERKDTSIEGVCIFALHIKFFTELFFLHASCSLAFSARFMLSRFVLSALIQRDARLMQKGVVSCSADDALGVGVLALGALRFRGTVVSLLDSTF